MPSKRSGISKGNNAIFPAEIQLPVASAQKFYCDVDRAKHVLYTHFSNVEKKNRWQGPAGIAVSLILAFITADFKDTLGLESEVWQAVAISVIIFTGYKAVTAAWQGRKVKVTATKIIEDLRNGIEG